MIRPDSTFRTFAIRLCLPSGSTNDKSAPNNVSMRYKLLANGRFVLQDSGAGGSTKIPSNPFRAIAVISPGHLTHVLRGLFGSFK